MPMPKHCALNAGRPARVLAAGLVLSVLAACATTSTPEASAWAPTIDMQHVRQARYEKDLAECRVIAEKAPGTDAKKEARKGMKKWGLGTAAGLGVLTVATGGLGAVAVLPMMAGSAGAMVGGGALMGGHNAKMTATWKYQSLVDSCLAGRGYKVLG